MIVCDNCGFKCKSGSKFCTNCATKLVEHTTNISRGTTKERFVTNTNILLAEGEVNVKSYHCTSFPDVALTRFFSLAADGYVSVTNKRVIFFGDGKKSTLFSEVDIDKVTGIVSYSGRGWNLLALLFWLIIYIFQGSIIFGHIAAFKFNASFGLFMLTVLSIAVLGLEIFVGRFFIRPWLYNFYIMGNGAEVTPVGAGNLHSTLRWWVTGQGALNSMMSFFPGPDKEKVVRELGALIKDIQTLGEFGIEKWTTTKTNRPLNVEKTTVDLDKNNDENIFA